MKIVIQCAGSKISNAETLRNRNGKKAVFIANPELYDPSDSSFIYVRPDDTFEKTGKTWRNVLCEYNEAECSSDYNLSKASDLYKPKEPFRSLYQDLAAAFGPKQVYILSAGWGLIRSDFRLPAYNITFSKNAEPWEHRKYSYASKQWIDFNHLQEAKIGIKEPIHFFGGNDYRKPFYHMTSEINGRKIVHYMRCISGDDVRKNPGYEYDPYLIPEEHSGNRHYKQTWFYQAAKDFLSLHRK